MGVSVRSGGSPSILSPFTFSVHSLSPPFPSSLFLRLLIASPYLTLFTLFLFPPISSSFFFSTFLRFHPVPKVQLGSLEKCYALPQQGPGAEPWPKHVSVHFELKYHDWRHILVTYFHAKVSARKVPPFEK